MRRHYLQLPCGAISPFSGIPAYLRTGPNILTCQKSFDIRKHLTSNAGKWFHNLSFLPPSGLSAIILCCASFYQGQIMISRLRLWLRETPSLRVSETGWAGNGISPLSQASSAMRMPHAMSSADFARATSCSVGSLCISIQSASRTKGVLYRITSEDR